jgi:membrane-associated phospholipid phosphatase
MPSLHTAFATIIALFVAGRIHSRWRWLCALYPLAMGCALVYLGEHYVVDLLAGAALTGAVRRLGPRAEPAFAGIASAIAALETVAHG